MSLLSAFLELLIVSCVVGQNLNNLSTDVNPTAINSHVYPDINLSDDGSGMSTELTLLPTPLPYDISHTDVPSNFTFTDFIGDGLCSCDLLVSQCDSLCCCDRDCSLSSQRLFNCSSLSSAHDVCVTAGDIVRTALAPCSCPNPSLFCVVTEQDAFVLNYGPAVTVTNVDDFSNFESVYSVPRDTPLRQYHDPSPFSSDTSNYLVGDPILILTLATISSLTLPSPFNALQCHDGNPITYFVDASYKCERPLSQLSSTCSSLSASAFYEGIFVLERPYTHAMYIAVEVSAFLCRGNTSSSDEPCPMASSVYDSSTSVCKNAIWEVSYTIFHNGAGRIDNVSVEITTGNITEQTRLIQQFSVIYSEMNPVPPDIGRRSGNPGYVEGEIILAGSLSEVGTVDLNTDSNMWLHIRESTRNCEKNRLIRPIRFLWDVQTTCLMSVSADDLVDNCSAIQQRSFSSLTPDTVLDHIGIFGNSDPLVLSQWLEVINETVKAETQQPLPLLAFCSNVLTSLDISILYFYTGDVNNAQAVLSGVKYTYTSQNIASSLVRNGKLALHSAVKFINITPNPNQVLQSLKVSIMKLPQDFLYPFFTSSTDANVPSNDVVLIVIITVSTFYCCR